MLRTIIVLTRLIKYHLSESQWRHAWLAALIVAQTSATG